MNPPDRIRAVEARADYRLVVQYETGENIDISLGGAIRQGGVFEPLRDQRLFSRVRIGEARDKVEWPEPKDKFGEPMVDVDAESLWYMHADQQHMTAFQRLVSFFKWFHSREGAKPE